MDPPLKWNIKCLQKELNLIFFKLRHPNLSLTVDFIVFIAVASIAACSDKRLSWEQELLLGPSASVLSAAFTMNNLSKNAWRHDDGQISCEWT